MENVFFIFRVLHNLLQTLEGLREFETVMQTPEEVEGIRNYREFCQPHVTKTENGQLGAGNGERKSGNE